MYTVNLTKLSEENSNVLPLLNLIDPTKVHFEDYLTATNCFSILSSNVKTKGYVNNLVLFVSNESNIDIPEQSNNENHEIYYQKIDKENKLVVNKLIWSIRPKPMDEMINQDEVLENCRAFLQAFNDALLLDKLTEEGVASNLGVWKLAKWDVKSTSPVLTEIDVSHLSKESQNIIQSLTEKEEIDVLEDGVIDRWRNKIISITLFMKSDRSYHDLNIFHKVLGKKYWVDKDVINKLCSICDTINLHVILSNKTHVLSIHDISKITSLDEDAFIQYLYDRIHNK